MESNASSGHNEPWNKGKIVEQKAPFKLKDIWALRVRLQMEGLIRELALFNLGIDSKLRGCDLVSLKVRDVYHGDQVASMRRTKAPLIYRRTKNLASIGTDSAPLRIARFRSAGSAVQPLSSRLGNCIPEVYQMTKRIERSRIESGKVELPRKLGFLTAEKVDFLSVTDRDGEFSVEMPVAALSKLVKAKGELKALKDERKSVAAGHASALEAEKDAHAETQAALAKAERRIKALTKKLEVATPSSDSAGAAKTTTGATPEAAKTAAASVKVAGKGQPKSVKSAEYGATGDTGAPATIESAVPVAPRKVSQKKAVAEAAESVVAPTSATEGPAALH